MGPTKTGHVERLAGNLLRVARLGEACRNENWPRPRMWPQSTIARIESGARQPSLPMLARILAAVDLELRINLEAYDAHDDAWTPRTRG